MGQEKSKLELGLFVLLIGQAIFMAGILFGHKVNWYLYGSTFQAMLITITYSLVYLYLIYGLLKPTRTVLIIGTLFCGLGVLDIVWPTGMIGWSFGLTIKFRLFEVSNVVISLNISNLILFALFLKALSKRPALNEPTAVNA